jgi:hypothetical protein
LTLKEKITKLKEKIKEEKWTGVVMIFYNSGGEVGIRLLKEDKEIEVNN